MWPAAARAAKRDCDVVDVLCMLSEVYTSGVSFREEIQNIGNISSIDVLIFNPNVPCIFVHSDLGSVTHGRSTDIDRGLRTADSDEHNNCSHRSTAPMSVSHPHGVTS